MGVAFLSVLGLNVVASFILGEAACVYGSLSAAVGFPDDAEPFCMCAQPSAMRLAPRAPSEVSSHGCTAWLCASTTTSFLFFFLPPTCHH